MNFKKHKFYSKLFFLISFVSIFVQSFFPYLATIPVAKASEALELKQEVEFNTKSNSFEIKVNTNEQVKYSVLYKSRDKIEPEIKGTSANDLSEDFEKADLYAGIESGEDNRADTVVRGIFKVQVKSKNWVSAIKFSITDGQLKEEGKKLYEPDPSLFKDKKIDYSKDELDWIENGDQVYATPTLSAGEILDDGASIERDLSPTSTQDLSEGKIETEIVQTYQCLANSLNGCVVTDKEDYTPNEVVLITGHGFLSSTPHILVITSPTGPLEERFGILTDELGSFNYSYQLDGTYRPNYFVEIRNIDEEVIASMEFTDHYNFKVIINSNDLSTNNLDVTLNLTWDTWLLSPDPLTVRYANDTTPNNGCWNLGTGSWSDWESISDLGSNTFDKNWTLASGGDGTRRVCVETWAPIFQFRGDWDKIDFTAPKGSISGYKWEDLDFEGDKDTNEPLLNGWTVKLYNGDSQNIQYLQETITGSDGLAQGMYKFENLTPDTYHVCEFQEDNWQQIYPNEGLLVDAKGRCHTVNLNAGDNITNKDFGNYEYGTVRGMKYEDINSNGVYNSSVDDPLGNWEIRLYDAQDLDSYQSTTTNPDGSYEFKYLAPNNDYDLCEVTKSGWTQTGPVSGSNTINNPTPNQVNEGNICYRVKATSSGQIIENYDFGNFQQATIQGKKFNDVNNDKNNAEDPTINDWIIRLYYLENGKWNYTDKSRLTGHTGVNGQYQFTGLKPATYFVCEALQDGWQQTWPSSVINQSKVLDEASYCRKITVNESGKVYSGKSFGNMMFGKITIDKITNPSKDDTNFEFMIASQGGDLKINLADQDDPKTSSVLPGSYSVVETENSNWNNSDVTCISNMDEANGEPSPTQVIEVRGLVESAYAATLPDPISLDPNNLTVRPGEEITCTFTNEYIYSTASISKINNLFPVEQAPGNTVEYSIFLKVEDNDLIDTKVVDLPPGGFKYVPGSYKVYKGLTDITSQIDEPAYASPGTWNLGNLAAGDEIKLTYLAKITDDLDLGLYKDMAFAYGCSELNGTEACSPEDEIILASAVASGGIDDGVLTDNYVGTKIALNKETTSSQAFDVEKEEEQETTGSVLGASTFLPKTGANSAVTKIAILVFALSLLCLLFVFKRRTFTMAIIIVFMALFIFPNSVRAIDYLSVRLENPKSPTNINTFSIGFTTMDIKGSAITAKCLKKGPSEAIFSQFGGVINISAGGNSGKCLVNQSLMNNKGTYQFKVEVVSSADTAQSEIVTVDYNTEGPGTPTSYSKAKINNGCEYRITARTANDSGKTSKVELYRSSNMSFNADSGTRIHTFVIGSDSLIDHTNFVPDCSNNYYYALRAFDSYGNSSGVVGDENIKVTYVSGSNTTSGNVETAEEAIYIDNANLPNPVEVEGTEVLVEEENNEDLGDQGSGETDVNAGEVLGAQKNPGLANQALSYFKTNPLITVIILIFVTVLTYASAKIIKSRKSKN